jgi:hypothetical protein
LKIEGCAFNRGKKGTVRDDSRALVLIKLPDDVKKWFHDVFAALNIRVSAKVSRIPTTHEVSLDLTFVEHLSHVSAPIRFASEWIVRLETHFVGGLRHWFQWEIADVGVLIMYRYKGSLVRTKVALLQSKRLYPNGQHIDEDRVSMYETGFARLYHDETAHKALTARARLRTDKQSKYLALIVDDKQYTAIADFERSKKIPVHYLLYNPLRLPNLVTLPAEGNHGGSPTPCRVGARVIRATQLRQFLRTNAAGYQPQYADLLHAPFNARPSIAGWRLEHFIVDLLLGCHEGYIATGQNDERLADIFFRRGGPIAAAVAITIDAPVPFAD